MSEHASEVEGWSCQNGVLRAAGLGTQTAQMDDFRLAEQRSMAVESDHLLILFKSNTELWRKEDIYVSLCSCACNNDPFELLCDDRTFRGRLRLKRRVRNIWANTSWGFQFAWRILPWFSSWTAAYLEWSNESLAYVETKIMYRKKKSEVVEAYKKYVADISDLGLIIKSKSKKTLLHNESRLDLLLVLLLYYTLQLLYY